MLNVPEFARTDLYHFRPHVSASVVHNMEIAGGIPPPPSTDSHLSSIIADNASLLENLPLEIQRSLFFIKYHDQQSGILETELDSLSKERDLDRMGAALWTLLGNRRQNVREAEVVLEKVTKEFERIKTEKARYEERLKELYPSNPLEMEEELAVEGLGERKVKRKGQRNKQQPKRIVQETAEDEGIYCFCRDVSYGQMVACENPDCPNEWYHFRCVKMSREPKGDWWCPLCRDKKKK
ncbi:Inhibitor of growth protein 5 [Neolecta irregularis DAH-3]|uniref:Inhibitor of growth protein 5 n=1 Tax=Neolecta irregularis (strain DAH-3) TaxID=1198029 RepID=A0A1U7LLK4_NEOID|nr:Inhibitor of growth protein 5 [Neolecta irregularis DAH-3]|eukprot:OLL23546.1 Inhibitor of growth protein 5 [Neolecta irregularis DAH-3]